MECRPASRARARECAPPCRRLARAPAPEVRGLRRGADGKDRAAGRRCLTSSRAGQTGRWESKTLESRLYNQHKPTHNIVSHGISSKAVSKYC